jgi:tetratricopeptide (TPR) repeat protein
MTGRLMKLALTLTYFAIAVYFYLSGNQGLAALFVLAALFIGFAIVRQGSVALAIKAIRENNLQKAKFHVKETIRPEWLSPAYRAYHFMAKGYVEASEGKTEEAIESFETSLTHKVRHADDLTIVKFQLAVLYAEKQDFEKAKALIAEVKALNPNPGLLEQVKKAEKKIKAATSGRVKFNKAGEVLVDEAEDEDVDQDQDQNQDQDQERDKEQAAADTEPVR